MGAAQHSVHWTLGTAASRRAAVSSIFLASSFLCSQAESTPAPAPVTLTVRRAIILVTQEKEMGYKRVVITAFGGPEVLKMIEETKLPEPKSGEVRVKVLVTSAAFTDVWIRKGTYPDVKEKPPFSPGYDMVGVVDKLGEGVTHFKVGQRVADLTVIGAYSEYLC